MIRTFKIYAFVALILLLLFSPLIYESIVHPNDLNEEHMYIDYPPRIMYNDALYKAYDGIVEDRSALVLVGNIESITLTSLSQNFQTNIEAFLHCNLYVLKTAPNLLVVEYDEQLYVYTVDEET